MILTVKFSVLSIVNADLWSVFVAFFKLLFYFVGAAVSVVLLDRLLDDQIQISSEIVEVYKDRPLRLVSKFIKRRHGSELILKKT